MFTHKNATLVAVKIPSGTRNQFGQPTFTEYRLDIDDRRPVPTWVDFSVTRKVELKGEESPVEAEWEVRKFLQDVVRELIGRNLQTGDMVQFSGSGEISLPVDDAMWFTLGRGESDAGIFNSVPMQKFNLVASVRT